MKFEEIMKESIIKAYIEVMGEVKWNSLTNEEKDNVLHLVLNDFAKAIMD